MTGNLGAIALQASVGIRQSHSSNVLNDYWDGFVGVADIFNTKIDGFLLKLENNRQ